MTDMVGWFSSAILVLTIVIQVHRQWSAGSSKGVSIWLFIGQATASVGFLAYSLLIDNWVFAVTNCLTAAAAVVGLAIVLVHRRREARKGGADASDSRISTAAEGAH